MGLLNGQLSAVFNRAFAGIYLPATLHVSGSGYDDAGNPTAGADIDYDCRAMIDDMSEVARAQAGYTERERRIMVLADSVDVVPTTNDSVTVKGERYAIMDVNSDPAESYYSMRCQRG